MAAPASTFISTTGVVNREDLSDVVYMISPTETPFLSGIGKTKATNTLHEWTTDVLDAAQSNAQLEGDDAVATAVLPGTRTANRTQISRKVVRLSGTQQAMQSAGNLYSMAKQMSKQMAALKRDMEWGLTQNATRVDAGNRQSRGLEGWLATNSFQGAGGAAPILGSNTAPVDGTQRAFTEALLKTALQQIWSNGGKPDTIMVGGSQKQAFSTFTAGFTQMGNADDSKLVATVDVYVSDFGTLKVVPNRFQRTRTAFILEMEKWAVAYLRSFDTVDLAKTGDSDAKQVVVEYTLEARNEAASGAVRDLT